MLESRPRMMDAATRFRYLVVAASVGARITSAEEVLLLKCADRMGIPKLQARETVDEVGQGGTISLPDLGRGAEREAFLSDLIAAGAGEELPFLQRVGSRFGVSREDVARWAEQAWRSAPPRVPTGPHSTRTWVFAAIVLLTAGLLLLLYLLRR